LLSHQQDLSKMRERERERVKQAFASSIKIVVLNINKIWKKNQKYISRVNNKSHSLIHMI